MIKIKRVNYIIINILFLILLSNSILYAQVEKSIVESRKKIEDREEYIVEDYERFKKMESPTVAIALTGGGAKAFFNIGVIKALEEAEISIDIIVGSSMGSIVGVMYGSGLSIEQIEEVVTEASFAKMLDVNFMNNDYIIESSKVNKFIEDIAPNQRLEDFPISTALLALELNSGNKYLISTGEISKVIQASYAIPYFFPHSQLQDNNFADPGIIENSPAKAARVLGADFVIGTTYMVDKSNNTYESSQKIASRYLEIVEKSNTDRIINNYADVIIESDIGTSSFIDFDQAAKLIEIGYKDTKEKITEIKEKLKQQNIPLRSSESRERFDLTEQFIDLKYDRLVLDSFKFRPLIYYGQSLSSFDHTLFNGNMSQNFQYGFGWSKNNLRFDFLSLEDEEMEAKLRWIKLSDRTDLISKFRLNDDETEDWKLGIRYYMPNQAIEIGGAKLRDEKNIYCDSNCTFETSYLYSNNDLEILYFSDDSLSTLISSENRIKLSNIWSLAPRVVFNNTDVISSPIIYRGKQPDDFVEFQAAVDFNYTYDFLESLEIMKIIQLTNIDMYLFSDYQNSKEGSLASGLGAGADLKLLGLKPVSIDAYLAYDDATDETETNFIFSYQF